MPKPLEIQPASMDQIATGRGEQTIVIGDDVGSIARQLKEIDDSLVLGFKEEAGYFIVFRRYIDHRGHHIESMVTTATELDHRLLKRVQKIASPQYDFAADLAASEFEADQAFQHKQSETIAEAGERLFHAIKAERGEKSRITVAKNVT